MHTFNATLFISALLLSATSSALAEESSAASFLQPGNGYILSFAGKSPFQKTEGIPLDPRKDDVSTGPARITSASITYSINVFTVVEHCGNSWVLLEHPKSIKDAFKWNFKRLAIAALNPDTVAKLQSSDEGKAKLANLRKQADAHIETDRSWVNLAHVVAIAKPPQEPQDYKLNMSVRASD